ncbi:MFS transporter [Spirochaeta isovalerica]|uniref:OFA family oxalate/formate antiporter-like MFS transporter n=1 Tax=Spirochaeta isovalerica TaxID=150 RepID=A0A841R9B2_9SPIO|nr:MFS transporter [Spirochaeta isovalerica]MBB6479951.1 OFA family oxalate/formate antiporter-like MFS transporter [Spirochaeta isovalerica]
MNKKITVVSAFLLMLCLGGVYAWSLIASELVNSFGYTTTETQIIFGLLIAVFPLTMIGAGKLAPVIGPSRISLASAFLFTSGYLLAGLSRGSFPAVLIGISLFSGMATGLGYWVALTIPVQLYPERKGLITGLTSAGFGLGALVLSKLAGFVLQSGRDVFQLFVIIAVLYGLIILFASRFIKIDNSLNRVSTPASSIRVVKNPVFLKLFLGIFFGTFAGLLIVGSLKLIGMESGMDNNIIILSVSLLSVANFTGRIFWGAVSDRIGAGLSIVAALFIQAAGISLLSISSLSGTKFLLVTLIIGLGFGGNFVLFARETAQKFGVAQLGSVYPYVFLGYAAAGIGGPVIGGLLNDLNGTFSFSIYIAALMSLAGALLYFPSLSLFRQRKSIFPEES